jgi:hypothetical protein
MLANELDAHNLAWEEIWPPWSRKAGEKKFAR